MNELNEKMAELCGIPHMIDPEGQVWHLHPEFGTVTESGHRTPWNPTGNDPLSLGQLKMCWEEAEKGSEDAEKFESMVYWHVSEDLRLINKCFLKDITTAIFKHPELVAQAILKAKGVS